MHFDSYVKEIRDHEVIVEVNGNEQIVKNDFVFAMTGYHPDHDFIKSMGVNIDQASGRPTYNEETMETNIENLYIAGVIAAGNNANEIFIENGRFHGGLIAKSIESKNKI